MFDYRLAVDGDSLNIPTNARARLRAARRKEGEALYYSTYNRRVAGDGEACNSMRGHGDSFVDPSWPLFGGSSHEGVRAVADVRQPGGDSARVLGGRRVNHSGQATDAQTTAMQRIIQGDFYGVRGPAVPEASQVVPLSAPGAFGVVTPLPRGPLRGGEGAGVTYPNRTPYNGAMTPLDAKGRYNVAPKIGSLIAPAHVPLPADFNRLAGTALAMQGRTAERVRTLGHGTAEADILSKRRTSKHMRFSPQSSSRGCSPHHVSAHTRTNTLSGAPTFASEGHANESLWESGSPLERPFAAESEGDPATQWTLPRHEDEGYIAKEVETKDEWPSRHGHFTEVASPESSALIGMDANTVGRRYASGTDMRSVGGAAVLGRDVPRYMRATESAAKRLNTGGARSASHSHSRVAAFDQPSAKYSLGAPSDGQRVGMRREALAAARSAPASASVVSSSELDLIRRIANSTGAHTDVRHGAPSRDHSRAPPPRRILY